jgi:PAS domain S-box-containing protein
MKEILVVDNHPVILKFMANLLEKKGHRVLTASDGLSALEILKTNIPDVIFVDLVMPNINGEKLCRVIRDMPKLKDVFLIILSAIAAEEDVCFTDYGANAWIAKVPFNKMAEHVLTVLDHLDQGRDSDLQGKVIGRDDLYKRQITKELLASKRHFEAMLNNITEGILELTNELKIVYANPAAISIIGVSEEMLLSSDFTKLFHETHHKRIKDLLKDLDDKPLAITQDSPVELNNKQVSLNIIPVKDHEHSPILVILSDVSRRKQMEAQLQQAHKMEAIGTLTGGVAHDFNNILAIILGNTELALDDVPEWNPAHFNLEEIKTVSIHAKDVVRQILSFIRTIDLKRKPINIIPAIKGSLKFLRATIPTSIDIRQNIKATADTILADPTQIHQVMINLCTNASHAMQKSGGIMEIEIQNVVLYEDSASFDHDLIPGNYVKVTISDTGQGMDPEIINRIFDPYFTTKEVGKGSGMGLSVVHGIVKSYRGTITVASEVGKGTTFNVYFPVVEEETVTESKIVEDFPTGNERILFIDDEKSIVNITRQMLERLGYQVETKMNPVEALELFLSGPEQFDLVITNMAMPFMTGDKLAKEIINIRSDMPIIICTGFSEKMDGDKAREIGASGYLEKPHEKRDLAKMVRKILDL